MLELLAAAAPYLVVAALFTLIGAGFGYAAGYSDAQRAPRYRRRGDRSEPVERFDVAPRP